MSQPVLLTGITWDHSRAFPPLVATAQRFEETHPGVRIRWEKRTLDDFGHLPIDQLAHKFDLIIIDHPWAGFAFEKNLVLDLKPLLSPATLDECAQDSIGAAFESYCYAGSLLALPIDAASPAPSWRPDLLKRAGAPVPTTWTEAVALARRKLAVIPAFNADLFLHFLMLLKALGSSPCAAGLGVKSSLSPSLPRRSQTKAGGGERVGPPSVVLLTKEEERGPFGRAPVNSMAIGERGPFANPEHIAPREVMRTGLNLLRELTEPMPRAIFDWNPIQVAERMTATDDFAWNAFAYSYNNYARDGFARARLRFGNLMSLEPDAPRLRGVLGGTGIAISSHCSQVETALDYARFVAHRTAQKAIYFNAGGQPSHRAAWDDAAADSLCGGFFSGTRTAHEEAFIRPRYSGYVPLQTNGGNALQEALRDGRDVEAVLEKLDTLYRQSRQAGSPLFQTN